MKKTLLFIAALLLSVTAFAQLPTGGVKGCVVDRQGRTPISAAHIVLSQKGATVAECSSDANGNFQIDALANGMYDMHVTAEDFSPIVVNVTVDGGFVKDMHFVTMTAARRISEVDDSSFTESIGKNAAHTATDTY